MDTLHPATTFKNATDAAIDAFWAEDKAAFADAIEHAKEAAKNYPEAVEYLSESIKQFPERFPDSSCLCLCALVRAAEVVCYGNMAKEKLSTSNRVKLPF